MLDIETKDKIFSIESAIDDCIIDLLPFAETLRPLFDSTIAKLREQREELQFLREDK